MAKWNSVEPAIHNREKLQFDPLTGYQAESKTFFFGNLGKRYLGKPYITIVPGKKDTMLVMRPEEFTLFDWAISISLKVRFDENGDSEFSYQQWMEILDEAEKLVSFANFDELFEYMKGIGLTDRSVFGGTYNVMLNCINCDGAEFWKNISKFRLQLEDMIKWTDLALLQDEKMTIIGF